MASQFLSLDDAAKKLGISSERLVELRSQGKIRGFRDGASWKFPENEIDRLADDLASESGAYNPYQGMDDAGADEDSDDFGGGSGGGSGVLVDDLGLGSGTRGSKIIGGDSKSDIGSDVGIGSEPLVRSGSDVNLVAGDSDGSDVMVVASSTDDSDGDFLIEAGGRGLVEIDSGELQLSPDEPAISHDSAVLDLAIEPNAGSTGPITDKELKALAKSNPNLMVGKKPSTGDSGLAFDDDDDDSGDDLIGADSADDILGSDLDLRSPRSSGTSESGSPSRGVGASSLELMDDLDILGGSSRSNIGGGRSSRGIDVLSELDLLSADAGGSGLITGDSGSVLGGGLGSSGAGSGGIGSSRSASSKASLNFDDALADDDDLVIADDEDDLVLGGGASDVSVSGDSGINLMSPSDSGLSLESEPLDLAGSSISALDLGAELGSDIGSGSGRSGSSKSRGSAINFQGDEDFRLSPSGLGIETDAESNSQVIEVEDSSSFADPDAFGDAEFSEAMPIESGFDDEAVVEAESEQDAGDGFGVSTGAAPSRSRASAAAVYEIPFSVFQVGTLLVTLTIMCVGGMLMTDLLRNMWAYSESEAPVSSLTNALVDLANLGG